MKKNLALLLIFTSLAFIFSEEINDANTVNFDDLFTDAEDIVVKESETPVLDLDSESLIKDSLDSIKFSGSLSSEIGFEQNLYPSFNFSTAGITLSNNLSFTSRTSDIFGVHGNLYTYFNYKNNDGFTTSLNKFYFDYLLNKIYIKVGKRSISWGNTKVDWDDDDYFDLDVDTNVTNDLNIVYDNDNDDNDDNNVADLSASFIKYFGASDAEFLILYDTDWNDVSNTVTFDSISFAAQTNIVIGTINTTLFLRSWAVNDDDRYDPVAGIEFNTSFLDFDIYSHSTVHLATTDTDYIPTTFDPTSGSFIFGLYRLWENPRIGMNIEYARGWDEEDGFTNSFATNLVISHLFNNSSRIAVSYEYSEGSFGIVPLYEYYNLEDATFDIAVPINFNEKNGYDITVQIGLIFNLNY